ncbi:MAG: GreA/GreB family elongation factor [Candidatus Shikimatogenerans bostrichidophilus]|nr:MAG: GreA/GreB family elongation factor [Candidatus Shikimatogenerans bostrichidophilus]
MEYITKSGLKKIKIKLLLLKNNKKKIINQIKEALEKGDLSENYEYFAAKESYELLQININKLKKIFFNSKLINKKKNKKKNKVYIFSVVTIKNLINKEKIKYEIVPNNESNIKKNKISIKSPMSLSLLGKKVGYIFYFKFTKFKYKIIKIE